MRFTKIVSVVLLLSFSFVCLSSNTSVNFNNNINKIKPNKKPLIRKSLLKFNKKFLPRPKKTKFITGIDKLDRAYKTFRNAHSNHKLAFDNLNRKLRYYRNRKYTIQDQTKAGCRDTQTIKDCTISMYKMCMFNARQRYVVAIDQYQKKRKFLQRQLPNYINIYEHLKITY